MTRTFLDSEYSRVHLETVDALAEKLRSETLLIDGWEDILRRSIYGVATAHVGKPSVVLGLRDLTGHRGNAAKIVETAQSCLTEMGVVDAGCLLAVVTDNPSVMQKFRKEIEQLYSWIITLACFCHLLNTTVGEILSYKPAKAQASRANRIVTFFNGSHFWGGQLKVLALADAITRGLKRNCESRWYALILLCLSVQAHRVPLNTLIARPDARKSQNGLSIVHADVRTAVQDYDDSFWPMIDQLIRVAKPLVDAIAVCESQSATLADCMLQFLGAARRVANVSREEGDDPEFIKHAHTTLDKRFWLIATPLHRLALFLHPLCRKLAVLEYEGFTLRDLKLTALTISKEKWNWSREDCAQLGQDVDDYYACRKGFEGGNKDPCAWWKSLTMNSEKHKLKLFAVAILSIVPHAAEIERLFSSLNGIQSPKRNGLSIPTFDKLAKLRSYYAEEVRHQTGQVASSERRFTQIHSEEGPVLEKSGNLDVWEGPMYSAVDGLDGNADDDEPMSGVEVVFRDVERTLEEEKSNDPLTAAGPSLRSLMKGELYDFRLVKAALDCIVPQEVVDMVDVVKAPSNGDWSIEDML
ncbi:ribonuclease H-like domain-containing protein [Lentinula boryana]|uniref:Ribonuclease H-like domain-containing protein n=2 Tax=Lentinula TaxID=5352 RepID=A0ABQ8PWQ5_9AGAR|nr:ribonuclease H-like domain-containing protein [Lentinula boryana]